MFGSWNLLSALHKNYLRDSIVGISFSGFGKVVVYVWIYLLELYVIKKWKYKMQNNGVKEKTLESTATVK